MKSTSGLRGVALRHAGCWLLLALVATASEGAERLYYSMAEPAWGGDSVPDSDSPPVWSRDGSEVLFQQTRDEGGARIWAVRPDGSGLRALTDGSFRAGHPDTCAVEDTIVLVADRDGSRQLWLMATDGSELRPLTEGGRPKSWPAFSPDCRQVLFAELDPDGWYGDLRVVEVASGRQRTVLDRVRYLGWSRWSADGDWIYFYRERQGEPNHLWRVRGDGTAAQPLTGGDAGDFWSPDASRDGRWLTYAHNPRHRLAWGSNTDLWIQDLENGECRRLTSGRWHEHGQRVSPDGGRLAYWDTRIGYDEIRVLDLATGTSTPVTAQPDTELTTRVRRLGVGTPLPDASPAAFSERAMAVLLDDLARQSEPASLDLARHFRSVYPHSDRAARALARELLRAGHLDKAAAEYRSVVDASPASSEALARLAALERLSAAEGQPSEGLVNSVGYALLGLDVPAAAVDLLAWNAARHPESANAWDSFGEALYWYGVPDRAADAYRRSLALDPANTNAETFLSRITRGEPEPAAACPDLGFGDQSEASDNDAPASSQCYDGSESPDCRYAAALDALAAGEAAEALAALEILHDSEDVPRGAVRVSLARAHLALGRPGDTVRWLQRAMDLGIDPQDDLTAAELEALVGAPGYDALARRMEPCAEAGFRSLDFLLGDWEIHSAFNPGGPPDVASYRTIEGGCAIQGTVTGQGYTSTELWLPSGGGGDWRAAFIDSQGWQYHYSGSLEGEELRMHAEVGGRLYRMRLRPEDGGTVTLHVLASRDGGETWELYLDSTLSPLP